MSNSIHESRIQAARDRLDEALRTGALTGVYRATIAKLEADSVTVAQREAEKHTADISVVDTAAAAEIEVRATQIAGEARARVQVSIERLQHRIAITLATAAEDESATCTAEAATDTAGVDAGTTIPKESDPDQLIFEAKKLAETEIELRQALVTLTEAGLARGAIEERISAKNAAITEARRIRFERVLTDQEAAQFNLDLLDQKDLEDMLAAANSRVTELQMRMASQDATVEHIANTTRVQGLVAWAVELEQQLCTVLQVAFDVARKMERGKLMPHLWTASSSLKNAFVHGRPPSGAL